MVLRIVLGALYVAMAAGQLASWPAMPGILGAYDASPAGVLPWLAAVLIAAELLAGAWLLIRPRSRALTPVGVYTAVALFWAVLGAQAFARGLAVHNCGCFGRYLGQQLSWFTLAQDGLLLLYAAIMLRGGLRARRTRVAALTGKPTKEMTRP
jgi:Methylamine utilisation protein MauE